MTILFKSSASVRYERTGFELSYSSLSGESCAITSGENIVRFNTKRLPPSIVCITGLVLAGHRITVVPLESDAVSDHVYISQSGTDSSECLLAHTGHTCRTLSFVLRQGAGFVHNIYIKGSPTPYTECHVPGIDASVVISQSKLTIKGYAGEDDTYPLFDCAAESQHNFVPLWSANYEATIVVSFADISFSNMILPVVGPRLEVSFFRIFFFNSLVISSSSSCEFLTITFEEVKFVQKGPVPFKAEFHPISNHIADQYVSQTISSAGACLYCKKNSVKVQNSDFQESLFGAVGYIWLQARFVNVSNKGASRHRCNFLFLFGNPALTSDSQANVVDIFGFHSSNTWSNHTEVTPEFSVIRVVSEHEANDWMHMDSMSFERGSRAIYVTLKRLDFLVVKRSAFLHNTAFGVGGSVWCHFDYSTTGKFYIEDNIFENNSAIKSSSDDESVSAGGALYITSKMYDCMNINGPNVILKRCSLAGNHVPAYGGSLYVGIGIFILIEHVDFLYNSQEHGWTGDLISAECKMTFTDVNITIESTNGETSGIDFVPVFEKAFIQPKSLFIECPIGHFLDLRFLLLPDSDVGVLGSLQTYCKSCSQKAYTPGYGFAYIGYETNFSVEANVYENNVSCLPCPYGGNCNSGLLSTRPQFWGYQHNGEVYFQRCPAGYCCNDDSIPCTEHNTCAPGRVGTLCGRCQDGYSESLLSTDCVESDKCTDYWVYPIYVIGAALYIFYYAYKSELAGLCVMIFKGLIFKCERKETADTATSDKVPVGNFNPNNKRPSTSLELVSNASPTRTAKPRNVNSGQETKLTDGQDSATRQRDTKNIKITEALPPSGQAWRSVSEMKWTALLMKFSSLDPKDKHLYLDKENSEGVDRGYLGIVTYFAQTSGLINVPVEFSDGHSGSAFDTVQDYALKCLNFDLYQVQVTVCPFPGINALFKSMIKSLFVLLIYCLWLFMFAITCVLCAFAHKGSKLKVLSNKFRLKLIEGLVEVIKYTYSSLASSNFSLLTCIYIGDSLIWKLDGTVTCFQQWQTSAAIFLLYYTIPFIFSLAIGAQLLKQGKISSSHFLFSCLMPLPFCLLWSFLYLCKWRKVEHAPKASEARAHVQLSDSAKVILDVLQGPYRDDDETVIHLPNLFKTAEKHNNNQSGNKILEVNSAVYWEGTMVFRRLVLNSLTLVDNDLVRLTLICVTCLIILLHHMYVSPFKLTRSNRVETLSLTFLILIAVMNTIKAAFSENGIIPEGPNESLLLFFQRANNVFLIALIAFLLFVELWAFFRHRHKHKRS